MGDEDDSVPQDPSSPLGEATDEEIEAVIGEPVDDADRQALLALRDFIQPVIFQATEQTAGMSRWLLASLLAVNGGAILASINSSELAGGSERTAIALWLLGILLALGSGFISMYGGQRAITIGSEMLSKVITSLQLGIFQDLRFGKQQQEMQSRMRKAIGIGLSSAAAFVAGCFVMFL